MDPSIKHDKLMLQLDQIIYPVFDIDTRNWFFLIYFPSFKEKEENENGLKNWRQKLNNLI